MEIWTAFTIGLLGSIHCVGMCGPIVLALPTSETSRAKVFIGRVLYNSGRIFTYSLFGALFGMLGNRIELYGFQQNISILLGATILLFVILPVAFKKQLTNNFFYQNIISNISKAFNFISRKKSTGSFFLIGVINGLLPCGFVYVGVAGAITTGSSFDGALYMALFGLGTFPVMFITSVLGRFVSLNFRKKLNRLVPLFAILLAVVFILRGLNLGIPFLSPKLVKEAPNTEINCH